MRSALGFCCRVFDLLIGLLRCFRLKTGLITEQLGVLSAAVRFYRHLHSGRGPWRGVLVIFYCSGSFQRRLNFTGCLLALIGNEVHLPRFF